MIFLNCIICFIIYFITSSLSLFGVHDIDNVRFHFLFFFLFLLSFLSREVKKVLRGKFVYRRRKRKEGQSCKFWYYFT